MKKYIEIATGEEVEVVLHEKDFPKFYGNASAGCTITRDYPYAVTRKDGKTVAVKKAAFDRLFKEASSKAEVLTKPE